MNIGHRPIVKMLALAKTGTNSYVDIARRKDHRGMEGRLFQIPRGEQPKTVPQTAEYLRLYIPH